MMQKPLTFRVLASALCLTLNACTANPHADLWRAYDQSLKHAKYIDLTHTITPGMPVWSAFPEPVFGRARSAADVPGQFSKGDVFTYEHAGFEAGSYNLGTDQLGTQLDPPAHWAPEFPAIDELPPTYTIRPLVVIQMQDQVAKDYGHQLQVGDIQSFERTYGKIPEGSVVFVRSDWSRAWPAQRLVHETRFPGVSLEALKFLHLKRHILMHGHEPLDTDDTPNLDGEAWLMHHGYAQAEGVANLALVKPTGCLVAIGYPKFRGGTGGLARYIAICPQNWPYGVSIDSSNDSPLHRSDHKLHWDPELGYRTR